MDFASCYNVDDRRAQKRYFTFILPYLKKNKKWRILFLNSEKNNYRTYKNEKWNTWIPFFIALDYEESESEYDLACLLQPPDAKLAELIYLYLEIQ